jgi:hypothetical protein
VTWSDRAIEKRRPAAVRTGLVAVFASMLSLGVWVVPDKVLSQGADTTAVTPGPARAVADTTPAPAVADTTPAPADSAHIPPPRMVIPVFSRTLFDSVPQSLYLYRHSYSLDNYLEFEPGYVMGRFGPIGKSTIQSRYGFGRGRCAVYLNNTLINDPQNDVAPLPHFPVSGLGVLLESGAAAEGLLMAEDGMEGKIRAEEAPPDPEQPTTFLELSKGTQQNLRQRRVWFSSMQGRLGLDFGYDEILNDGYSFDARQLDSPNFLSGPEYGRSRSRYLTVNLRGELPNRDRYVLSLRRFLADSNGNLDTAESEQGVGGVLAAVRADLGRVHVNVFSRGYDASTRPASDLPADSNTVNTTTAGYVDVLLLGSQRQSVSLVGGYESTDWFQHVRGASADGQLRRWTARLAAVADVGGGVSARAQLNASSYDGLTTGWGGSVAAERSGGRNDVELYLRRGYRMPNLGELFLPAHSDPGAPGATLSGNRYLKSEYGWEVGGRLTTRVGPVVNELRALALRVHRPIAFAYETIDGSSWLVAGNGDEESAAVIEERLRLDARVGGFDLLFAGGVSATRGDRESYFVAVPRWNAHSSFRFGRSIFQKTSALYFGLDYTYRSSRPTVYGTELASYHVLNLKLDGRLLNANLYLMVMNVFDERYQTISGYLMTPRTFVYGLSWRIFN